MQNFSLRLILKQDACGTKDHYQATENTQNTKEKMENYSAIIQDYN